MPPLIALIGPVLSAIGGGSAAAGALTAAGLGLGATELGMSLADRSGGSSQPTPAQQAASVAQQQNALKATVANNAPNYQAEAEGGLSPAYIANEIGNTTGTGANISSIRDLVAQFSGGGGGGGGTTVFPSGTPGTSGGTGTVPDTKGLTDLTQYLQAA